jgi:hypothetical protein
LGSIVIRYGWYSVAVDSLQDGYTALLVASGSSYWSDKPELMTASGASIMRQLLAAPGIKVNKANKVIVTR